MTQIDALKTDEIQNYEIEHQEEVRRLAGECIVILENDGVLPLQAGTKKIALFGTGARHTIKGGTGSGDVNVRENISIAQGLERAGFKFVTEGWLVESVTTVPDTVSIAGTDEALETLKQNDNTIWIGGTDIDITGETTDIEKKVSLKDVLPEDVKLTSGTSEDVWVKVSILPIGSHSYGLPSNQVTVDNLADNLLVTFGTDKIEIRVKATAGELDDFNLDEVKASVDLKDMEVGSYQIPVTVKLPKGFELLDDVVADVTISEVSNSDTNNE